MVVKVTQSLELKHKLSKNIRRLERTEEKTLSLKQLTSGAMKLSTYAVIQISNFLKVPG